MKMRLPLLIGVCLLLLMPLLVLSSSLASHAAARTAVGSAIPVDRERVSHPHQQHIPQRAASEPCFSEVVGTPFTPVNHSSVAWADYDKDDDPDLVISGVNNDVHTTTLYRNDNGTFVDSQIALIGVSNGTVAWADYDKNGYPDLIVLGENGDSDSIVKLYRNDSSNSSRTLTEVSTPFEEVRWGNAAWADYDKDDDPDLIISGFSATTFKVVTLLYRNDSGTFVMQDGDGYTFTGIRDGSMAWADYDGDTDLDLFITGRRDEFFDLTSVLYRNDSGKFVEQTGDSYPFPQLQNASVAWADYDKDGDSDLLIAGATSGGDTMTKLYRNDNGSFVDSGANLAAFFSGGMDWGDYDKDGDLDLIITGTEDGFSHIAKLYRNDGGTLTEQPNAGNPAFPGTWDGSVAWADYDGDNNLDLLITGLDNDFSRVAKLYRNDGCTTTASLQLLKSAGPTSPAPGQPITYTLHFTNTGSALVTGVAISDSVPLSVTVTGVTSSTFGNNSVSITQTSGALLPGAGIDFAWSIGELAVNAGGVITLTGILSTSQLLAGTTFTNTALIRGDGVADIQAAAAIYASAVAYYDIRLPLIIR